MKVVIFILIKDILIKNKNNKKVAIKYFNIEITYNSLFSKAMIYCNQLKEYNYNTKNIGIFIPNSIDYAISYFAITLLDKVIVPIGIQAKKAEIESTIEYCELQIIITNSQYKEVLKKHLTNTTLKITVFNLEDNSFEEIGKKEKVFEKYDSIKEEINENSVAIMLHTSGTTSNPKRVMLTHKNLITNIKSNIESLWLTKDDKVLIALPMFFGYCNTAQFLTHLYLGASIVILDGMFMPNIFFKLVQEENITNFTGVPSMLLMLLNYRNKHKYDITSLKYICFGGGKMPVGKLKQLIETFSSVGFVQTYGQTEASPRVTALLPDDSIRKIGSVGKPIPNVKVRIVNEEGKDVGVGERGEIVVQGNNVMKGYYKKKEESEKAIKKGWLYTGDLGIYDNEGYIYLVGRKKNMIISGGLNIYPEELEETMMHHPAVKEVCVVGEEHELMGEVPVAKVVLSKFYKEVSEGDIKNYCMDNLANYKVPSRIEFVNELPKTATGKVKRY